MSQNEPAKLNKFIFGIIIGILVAISLGYVLSIIIYDWRLFAQIFGFLPVFIYRSILISLTGIVTASLAGFIFGRIVREDTYKKIKITGISLGVLSLLSIDNNVFLGFIGYIFDGEFFIAFIELLPIIIVIYAGYKGAAYGYVYRKEVTDINEISQAKEYDKLSDKIGDITDYGSLAFQVITSILLIAGIGTIFTNPNASREVFKYMDVIKFIILPILGIIAVAAVLGKKALTIVLSVFGLGGFLLLYIRSTGTKLSDTAFTVFLGIIVLLVLIVILIYSIATVINGREKGLNPCRGILKKFAILLSLMPFVGLITGIYYFFLKEGKDFNENNENGYTGAICFILFFISLPIYIIGFIEGWI